MVIGLLSAGERGIDILGIGRIEPTFHCTGTVEDANERFITVAIGAAKNGAPIFKKPGWNVSQSRCCVLQIVENLEHSPLGYRTR